MLGSLFPRDPRRYLSLPLLGPIVDSFDDWLASKGYTPLSRKNAIYDLAHVDAQLRRRGIKEISNLTLVVLDDCRRSLIKKHPRCAGTVRPLERYLVAKSLIILWPTRCTNFDHIDPDRRIRAFLERGAWPGRAYH